MSTVIFPFYPAVTLIETYCTESLIRNYVIVLTMDMRELKEIHEVESNDSNENHEISIAY